MLYKRQSTYDSYEICHFSLIISFYGIGFLEWVLIGSQDEVRPLVFFNLWAVKPLRYWANDAFSPRIFLSNVVEKLVFQLAPVIRTRGFADIEHPNDQISGVDKTSSR